MATTKQKEAARRNLQRAREVTKRPGLTCAGQEGAARPGHLRVSRRTQGAAQRRRPRSQCHRPLSNQVEGVGDAEGIEPGSGSGPQPRNSMSRSRRTTGASCSEAAKPRGFAASEQLAPVVGRDLDIEFLGCGPDPLPGSIPLGVADPFDLVEAGDGIANVGGVVERLLAFGGKREGVLVELLLLGPRTVSPGALHLSGSLEIPAGCFLLLGGGHGHRLLSPCAFRQHMALPRGALHDTPTAVPEARA